MEEIATIFGLLVASFLAATILPMQSEALLVGLIMNTEYSPLVLIVIASTGNILGSCVNWWLGNYIETYKDRKWFPVSRKSLIRAQSFYGRYGRWSLLLSWVPIIGDPLTVMAGIMKEKFIIFLSLVSIAKVGRYVMIALVII